jgi:hypothetical protein
MFSAFDIERVGAVLARPLMNVGVPLDDAADQRVVMLDVPSELTALPWEWMAVSLKSRQPLCLHAPLCRRVPGLDDASRGRPFFHAPLRVLVVGDALAESPRYHHPLPGTRAEAKEIAALFANAKPAHDVTVLVGREATYTRVLEELATGYDIVHLTGVAYLDDSGESVVPLNDGWVSASELATLLIRTPPGLLFVNEDLSGFVPSFGDEAALTGQQSKSFADFYHRLQQRRPGLERVVARAGVGTFIGVMAPSQEDEARAIAVDFYSHLLAGHAVSHALFHARVASYKAWHPTAKQTSPATWPLFAMAGYPDARIVEPPNNRRTSPRSVKRSRAKVKRTLKGHRQ